MSLEKKYIVILVVVIVFFVAFFSSVFIVSEGRQVIVVQFGRPVGKAIASAGLHFKIPFIQDARYVEKRILTWNGDPNQIPTKDKKYISVDTTARWRIVDPLKYIITAQNERGATARLNDILDAITRDTISNHNLVEAVRNTNTILKEIKEMEAKKQDDSQHIEDLEVVGEIESISMGREELSEIIAKLADKELRQYGISIIDVQFKRISYESSVESKVYDRMISERQRIAEKIRAIGQGEKARIEGRMNKDLQTIDSEAYKKSKIIEGVAEAESINIYAKMLSEDPQFYQFIKTMDVYKNSLNSKTELILSSDSDFLKYLRRN